MNPDDLDVAVEDCLAAAAQNGYHYIGWPVRQIAINIKDVDPDLQDEDDPTVEEVEASLRRTIDFWEEAK